MAVSTHWALLQGPNRKIALLKYSRGIPNSVKVQNSSAGTRTAPERVEARVIMSEPDRVTCVGVGPTPFVKRGSECTQRTTDAGQNCSSRGQPSGGSEREPISPLSITSAIHLSQPAAGGGELRALEAGPRPGPEQYWTGEVEAGALGARERRDPFSPEEDQSPKVPCSVEAPAGPPTGGAAITS